MMVRVANLRMVKTRFRRLLILNKNISSITRWLLIRRSRTKILILLCLILVWTKIKMHQKFVAVKAIQTCLIISL